jgi:hypothetical protein
MSTENQQQPTSVNEAEGQAGLPASGCSAAWVEEMIRDNSRTRMRWESWARWPAGVMGERELNTMDEHDTEAQAKAACQMLMRDGFGGAGRKFPLMTWGLPPNTKLTHD